MSQSRVTRAEQPSSARRAAASWQLAELGGWKLEKLVSEGPLARTYRARPAGSSPDRPANYVVKLLRRRWWDDPHAVGLFRREALVGQTVAHRHLISVLAAAASGPPYYVVMPWLEGVTLAKRLREQPAVDLPVALWIARQVAEALDALDTAGWTHGDVKPGNIHVAPNGHVTLLDLGFARRRDQTGSAADRCVMGTCRYIAPEAIISALAVDIRSDIYSLGAVLFEVLSGRPPFEADGLAELAIAHKQARPPELRRLVPHLPSGVSRLVAQMLAKQPLRRPQTPRELIDVLTALEIATFTERAL